jgi:hypothetical protein
LSFLCNFLDALYYFWDGPGRRAKGSLQRATCRLIEVGVVGLEPDSTYVYRHDLYRSHAINDKTKNQCSLNVMWKKDAETLQEIFALKIEGQDVS